MANQRLMLALKALQGCQEIISNEWADNVDVRTPRLSDVVSLLERAASKLGKEATGDNKYKPKDG
jgi:hypothetical protein